MTDIDPNTFTGPNQGNDNGYIPYTTISQAKVDADFNNIKTDLDKLLATLQSAYSKLDTIETGATEDLTAEEITALINASQYRIDLDNLDTDVVSSVELNSGIETHRTTTNTTYMHPETSIKNTGLTYSNTPSSIKTSCANLLDEIKNLRFQIHKLNGKANWSDTPDNNIKSLTSNLQVLNSDLSNHSSDLSKHLTADQNAAIDGANVPSGTNVFVTENDLGNAGYGDMLKSTYDSNDDGIVDNADALDGAHLSDIQNEIDSDISTHASITDVHHAKYTDAEAQAAINNDTDHGTTAQHNYFSGSHSDLSNVGANDHHTKYTDSEAISAINNDTDHGSTAQHDYFSGNYNDLSNQPSIAYASTIPADAFSSGEVSNLQSNTLADGSEPWKTPLIQTTVSYTLQNTDYTVTCDTTSNNITITLPDASTVTNKIYNVKKVDNSSYTVTIDTVSSQTIDGETMREINVQYETITVQSTGNEWVII